MSLRRSARVQAQPIASGDITNGAVENSVITTSKERGRASTTAVVAPKVAKAKKPKDAAAARAAMPPPPTTPNKRRKVAKKDTAPPPVTPTPSAIGLMVSSTSNGSTGDIDNALPPPDRPFEPHHTNVTLLTPGGTQVPPVYSNFEDTPPSKAGPAVTTTSSVLAEACAHLARVSPKLKPVIEQHHCHIFSPVGLAEKIDPFRSLASGIISQQVSGAAAKSIKNKFIALYPASDCPNGFPTPKAVCQTSIPRLREAGLSQRKAEYIQGLAQKFADGDITVEMLMTGTDEEVMEKLIAVRGLGKWSVEMFMCFSLKRMDVFSSGDLGVQRGMAVFKGRDVAKLKGKGGKWKYMSEKEMEEIAEEFRPYRSLFMWYMWRIEDVDLAALEDN